MLTTTNVKDTYAGNGVTTLFPITFQFQENTQIYVFSRNTTTLVDAVLTVGSNYTVNGGDPGNEVELDVALASGNDLYIYRVTPVIQADFDAINNSAFLAEDLEAALDRDVMMLQEIGDRIPTEIDLVSIQDNADIAAASATAAAASAASAASILANTLTTNNTAVVTNKDIDGGTASNSNRITLPKAAKTTLDALTRKEGTVAYDTTLDKLYYDNGSILRMIPNDADVQIYIAKMYGTIPNTAPGAVLIAPEEFDPQSSLASGRYTCPVAGYYEVIQNTGISSLNSFHIWKNGSNTNQSCGRTDPTSFVSNGSNIILCAANDIIDLRPSSNATGSSNSDNHIIFRKLSGMV